MQFIPSEPVEHDFGVKIPDHIWEYVCEEDLGDGTYKFPEGTVVIRNDIIDWKANEHKEE